MTPGRRRIGLVKSRKTGRFYKSNRFSMKTLLPLTV